MMSFVTSLVNIGLGYIGEFFLGILFTIEGWVYQLVSYAFNLFLLMCGLNYSSIAGIASSLIDTMQAVIMVLVVFKLGIALIQYLIEPEKASKEGAKIPLNIAIMTILLIAYPFVFGVLNELSLLIMGNPTNYPYTMISTIVPIEPSEEDNKGLIMRLVLGESSDEINDIGDFLSLSTLSIFLHDYNKEGSNSILINHLCDEDGKCDFNKLDDLVDQVDVSLEYHGGLCLIMGIYLVYTIIKSAVQIGIRMFKLLILQMLAPIAIISVLDGGLKANTFQSYIKKYISVYIEAFTRLLTMLIVTVFVCKFFINIGDFFGNLTAENGFTNFLIKAIVVIAAYKFAGDIPKFIDEVLGTHMAGDGKKEGFGKFLGGLIGGGVGAVAGLVGGAAAGVNAGAGALGIVGNALTGAATGASGGFKGNNVADKIKNLKTANAGNYTRAQNIAAAGGLGNVVSGAARNVVGQGKRFDTQIGKYDKATKAIEAYDKGTAALLKQKGVTAAKYGMAGSSNVIRKKTDGTYDRREFSNVFGAGAQDIKMKSKDEYKADMRQYHKGLQEAIAAREQLINRGASEADIAAKNAEIANFQQESDDFAGNLYEAARNKMVTDSSVEGHEHAAYLRSDVNATMNKAEVAIVTDDFGGVDIKKTTSAVEDASYRTQDTKAYQQTHLPKTGK